MIQLVVGHRGSGKTTLFKNLSEQGLLGPKDPQWLDLDTEIENFDGRSIQEIFASSGEKVFRELELQIFEGIVAEKFDSDLFLILGAGFDLGKVPDSLPIIWIRRDSDSQGRIFLNRPRLKKDLSALDEFKQLYLIREAEFQKRAHRVVTIPEGLPADLTEISKLIFGECHIQGAQISYSPLAENAGFSDLRFELRTDLLEFSQIQNIIQKSQERKLLLSYRSDSGLVPADKKIEFIDIDIGQKIFAQQMELFQNKFLIMSSHLDSIEKAIEGLAPHEVAADHLKLCPLIESWKELKKGHEWQSKNPTQRSFLPRSKDGRWAWYRLYMKDRQLLNFVRLGPSEVMDQPTIWEYWVTPGQCKNFAAVLGDPVQHSFSPSQHLEFFRSLDRPYFRIKVNEADWDEAMAFLEFLGLSAASVTSPLKKRAFRWAASATGDALRFESANTLVISDTGEWVCHNTDAEGFNRSNEAAGLMDQRIAIWGGGGTLTWLQKLFPNAVLYSSQTGLARNLNQDKSFEPELLIWAAVRSELTQWPPSRWKPNVIDLNYSQNSMGLEYAQKQSLKYSSGEGFFRAQAQLQQDFWRQYL